MVDDQLPLYGHDLDDNHSPAEAGYAGMLTSQAPYVGRDGAHEVREKLTALVLADRRSARQGDVVALPSGETVGLVTSGSFAPSVGAAIAMAYIRADAAGASDYVLRTARAELPAKAASLPFYTAGTARAALV